MSEVLETIKTKIEQLADAVDGEASSAGGQRQIALGHVSKTLRGAANQIRHIGEPDWFTAEGEKRAIA